jgi:uncharacterized protein (TIGR02246 family)
MKQLLVSLLILALIATIISFKATTHAQSPQPVIKINAAEAGSTVSSATRAATETLSPRTGTGSDEQDIRALIARYGAAANARDLQAALRCYAEMDSLLVYDVSAAPFRGFAEVRRDWEQFMTAMRSINLEFRDIKVTVDKHGEFAYATFIERASLTPKRGAPLVNDNLRTTQIFRKMNGHWLIVHEHKSKPLSD